MSNGHLAPRPGFVLDVDRTSPPIVFHHGEGFRLEKLPADRTRVIYPAEPLEGLVDPDGTIRQALLNPLGDSEPLPALLRPGMKLTIAFDDISLPLPPMRRPDIRQRVIEAVLDLAAEAGVDLLEMDVRITADGVLVVHHDADVFGTTGGEGVVAEMTVAELQALDNAWWWSPTCWPCRDLADGDYPFRGVRTGVVEPPEGFTPDDFRIETFRSVAEAFPTLALDVEIKNRDDHAEAAIAALVADLDDLDRRDSVVVVSFSSDVVAAFKEVAPDVATSPGTDEMIAWILGGEALGDHPVVQVPPNYDGIEVLMEAFFTAVEEAGVEVWVWPDSTDQEAGGFYAELLDLGIDGIIAGRPAAFEQVLQDGGYVD